MRCMRLQNPGGQSDLRAAIGSRQIVLTVNHPETRYTIATRSAKRLGLHSGPCALSGSPFLRTSLRSG